MKELYPEAGLQEDNPLVLFLLKQTRVQRPIYVRYEEAADEQNITNLDQARALVVKATIEYIKKYEL